MSTINSKNIIDEIIQNNGYYHDDPRVQCIIEYTNNWGNITYGVTWINEKPESRDRYKIHNPPYINNPKIIWEAKEK